LPSFDVAEHLVISAVLLDDDTTCLNTEGSPIRSGTGLGWCRPGRAEDGFSHGSPVIAEHGGRLAREHRLVGMGIRKRSKIFVTGVPGLRLRPGWIGRDDPLDVGDIKPVPSAVQTIAPGNQPVESSP